MLGIIYLFRQSPHIALYSPKRVLLLYFTLGGNRDKPNRIPNSLT